MDADRSRTGTERDQDLLKYVDVGATYYFNKNMSTYVDYKINLLDDKEFTRNAGIRRGRITCGQEKKGCQDAGA